MNSKEFEENLQLKNFDELEQEYQKTKDFFLNLIENITCEEVPQRFPAFCLCKQEIRIKFPTYFIRIIDNRIDYSELENLLCGQGNFLIYEETNVVKISSLEPVHSLAIHCLESSLTENKELSEKIESILTKRKIISERCVSSGHYIIPMQIDENGYIHIQKS